MKKGFTILFLFLTSLSFSQNATLLKNVDFRAKELKHNLNKTGDTLILESTRTISKVTIFNSAYEKLFLVNKNATKIPIADLPIGRFVTEVKIHEKLIIITLIQHKQLNKKLATTTQQTTKALEEGDKIAFKSQAESNKVSTANTEALLETKPKKVVKFYWIVKHINKGHSSSKKMRFGDQAIVDKMIAQHQIDLKTKAGKHNRLTIWEVYDTSKFLRFKRQNPNYANTKVSDCFNTNPFYKSGT